MPTPEAALSDPTIDLAARFLIEAADSRRACPPIRTVLAAPDAGRAYAVQRVLTDDAIRRGRRPVGRKIGITSPAVQSQLNVDQPDFGVLFADMQAKSGGLIPVDRLLQPRVEAEVAFVLAEDLTGNTGNLSDDRARAAIGTAVAALEIVDSRIAGWDITLADTIADNASCGMFVLGDEPVELADLDLREIVMTMVDGEGTVVSSGTGRDCLGDPISALVWLARTSDRLGDPLRAGQVVLSGALGPMVPAQPGDSFHAELIGLGAVSVTFEGSEAS
jgi:2-keto-4-pentenoate hydratase